MALMNRGGGKPKPTALHRLEGTFRPDRHARGRKGEPQPQGDLEEAPAWLSDGARECWEYAIANSPKGLLKKLDRDLVAAWAVAADQLRAAATTLALFDSEPGRLPLVALTPAGLRLSLYFKAVHQAIATMIAVSDRLGLSPAARTRVSVEPEKPEELPDSAWATLRRFPIVIPGGKDRQPPAKLRRKTNGSKT